MEKKIIVFSMLCLVGFLSINNIVLSADEDYDFNQTSDEQQSLLSAASEENQAEENESSENNFDMQTAWTGNQYGRAASEFRNQGSEICPGGCNKPPKK